MASEDAARSKGASKERGRMTGGHKRVMNIFFKRNARDQRVWKHQIVSAIATEKVG